MSREEKNERRKELFRRYLMDEGHSEDEAEEMIRELSVLTKIW